METEAAADVGREEKNVGKKITEVKQRREKQKRKNKMDQ